MFHIPIGHVQAWTAGKYFELLRIASAWEPNLYYSDYYEDISSSVVVHSQFYTISRDFYDEAKMQVPFKFQSEANYVGPKSFSNMIRLINTSNDKTLITNHRLFVMINDKTGKLVDQLPESYKTFYKNTTNPPPRISIVEPPTGCFRVERKVEFSDYDAYYHVNTNSYVRWCADAAAKATDARALSTRFHGDFAENFIENIEMRHLNETFVPDTVRISVWECRIQKDTLLFWIDKQVKDKSYKVFFCRMKFFPRSDGIDLISKL